MWRGFACVALLLTAANDPRNPTCPAQPNWSNNQTMQLTFQPRGKTGILLAEGAVDAGLVPRLKAALKKYDKRIDEIWVRSPGGDAEAGNAAGLLINKAGLPTRIPAGWACFSACNFVFLGGVVRRVEPGGVFMVHMFTFTADGGVLAEEASQGFDKANETIRTVERDAALLASQDNDFMVRAGVSRKLLTEVMYRQQVKGAKGAKDQSTRRCLTRAEMRKYAVTNTD